MNTITHTFLLTGLASFACLISSCGGKKDDVTPEPVEAPVVAKKAPRAPVSTANPLDAFATPDGDLKLPTEAQTAEGKHSSIGTVRGGNSPSVPDTSPSVAISPPTAVPPEAPVTTPAPEKPAKPEDELDPQ